MLEILRIPSNIKNTEHIWNAEKCCTMLRNAKQCSTTVKNAKQTLHNAEPLPLKPNIAQTVQC